MSFKTEIIGQTWQGSFTKSLTANIGGGVYKATGLGNCTEYLPDAPNTFGFNGAWRTGIPFKKKPEAKDFITQVELEKVFSDPIVTTLEPLTEFYPAEEYHQNYFNNNQDQPYCQVVINPKLKKFKEKFASLIQE
jgi:hypothetical protein